jgi:hypothetical protein
MKERFKCMRWRCMVLVCKKNYERIIKAIKTTLVFFVTIALKKKLKTLSMCYVDASFTVRLINEPFFYDLEKGREKNEKKTLSFITLA